MSSSRLDQSTIDAIEAAKAASLAQVLFKAARLLDARGVAAVREASGMPLRPAHTNLFPHIDLDGTRQTELARRLGVSKQAVGQLVDELVEMGALERIRDPTDGRARLVRFVHGPDGTHGLLHGLAVLGQVEAVLRDELGPERWARLHGDLTALLGLLVDDAAT
jgi:DNA-binding transcriptional ArsR family regulator